MRKPTRQMIDTLLDSLLTERRKSDSSYAPVTDEDWETLCRLFNQILLAKFELDADGDLPIEYTLVNRHTHSRDQYLLIKYPKDASTKQELMDIIRRLSINVGIAANELDRMSGNLRYYMDRVDLADD